MNPTNPDKENLLHHCSDLFSIAITLRNSNNFGDPDVLLRKLKESFLIFEGKARALQNVQADDITLVRYALAALLDEIILCSKWEGKGQWQSHSLQLEFFNENIAGTEFFNKLDELRSRARERLPVLEAYYFCLVLGVEGKYKIEGLEKLRLLKDDVAAEIKKHQLPMPKMLSKKWEPPPEYIKTIKTEMPTWVVGVGFLGISFVIYAILNILLVKSSSDLLHTLEGLLSKVLG